MLKDLIEPSGYAPYAKLIERLSEIDGIEIDDEYPDTNGWEVDYWKYFTHNGEKYCLSGSMYYGTYHIRKK